MKCSRLSIGFVMGMIAWTLAANTAQAAPIDPASPTGEWVPVAYPSLIPDYSDDQQTGLPESDIVGNTTNAALYTSFDNAGTASATDGSIGFRVRLGAEGQPPGFDHFFAVGLDADGDGAIDLFLGVNNTGGADEVAIWDPGTGLNVSPSTTSIESTPIQSYSQTSDNYSWIAVDATSDPSASSFDVDADGNNDFFLSFTVDLQDVVDALVAKGIGFDDTQAFSLVAGTSTQANALNNDLGGPDGGTDSDPTWAAVGATSVPVSASQFSNAPEPDTGALFGLGLVMLGALRRRNHWSVAVPSPLTPGPVRGLPGLRGWRG